VPSGRHLRNRFDGHRVACVWVVGATCWCDGAAQRLFQARVPSSVLADRNTGKSAPSLGCVPGLARTHAATGPNRLRGRDTTQGRVCLWPRCGFRAACETDAREGSRDVGSATGLPRFTPSGATTQSFGMVEVRGADRRVLYAQFNPNQLSPGGGPVLQYDSRVCTARRIKCANVSPPCRLSEDGVSTQAEAD
jgi:hypothetical protein